MQAITPSPVGAIVTEKLPYVTPAITIVMLHPEEQLLLCGKVDPECELTGGTDAS